MAITLLRESSPSAPTLNGTAGTLIAVLDFCLVTTMGWVKEYSGTNLAVYRASSGIGGNRFYLRVDDTGGQNARIRCYESMSAVSTGTAPVPTDAQVNGGLYAYKSGTADTTARAWTFVSNGKMFYLFWNYSQSVGTWTSGGRFIAFGDFKSYKSGDAYNTFIMADAAASATSNLTCSGVIGTITTSITGHYLVRSYTQIGASIAANKYSDSVRGVATTSDAIGSGGITYPSPIEGGLIMAPIWVGEQSAAGARGQLPGIWNPCHARPLGHGDTFSGVAGLSGRSFEAIHVTGSSQVLIETSDTWDT
jgi:hypothetical protein